MNRYRPFVLFAVLIAATHGAWAQNAPHLAYVLPAGGRQGTSFEVKLGGQYLPNVNAVHVSGTGIEARIVDFARPLNGMQATQLRDRMQELLKQQPMTAEARKEMIDIRVKLFLFNYDRNISPVLAETMTLQVTIAADAEPGKRELRVQTPQGLSNPLVFCVGQLPEFTENEDISVNTPPGPNPNPQISRPPTNMAVTLPAVINGRIRPGFARPAPGRTGQPFTPGDADRYRFQARQGEHLVIAVAARELIPFLADAVPGWFQATVALFDSNGKELAYDDDFRFHPDPVLYYEIPKDGEYAIEIKDSIYRGREDFIYRITLGELPFLTGIFPLGGQAGSRTQVKLSGWNLPAESMTVDAKGKGSGVLDVSVRKENLVSNHFSFAVDSMAEVLEKEPDNTPKNAQKITLPVIVNGHIDNPGDWDVFSFEARAGEEIVAEVLARRLDSPLDSVLRLTDAAGRQVALNDDFQDKGAGLETHHADSLILAKLPAAGTYYLHLGDAQQKGGPEFAYRLRISAPRPDFELRIAPSAVNMNAGMTVPVAVYALRKDGFAGEISLSLKNAPRGFALSGGLIPAGQEMVRLTVSAPQAGPLQPLSLTVEGRATIQGREVLRTAVPAEDMMQAFAYRHLVPAQELSAFVRRGGPFRSQARVVGAAPLKIPAGGTANFQAVIPLPPNSPVAKIQYELSEPPEGITIRSVNVLPDGAEIVLQCDAAKAKAGLKGNLIVNISGERALPAVATKQQINRQRVPLGTLPAVPFEITRN